MSKKNQAAEEAPSPVVTVSKAKIFMKYVFTNEDMLALAQDMARALDEQHTAEDELKSVGTQIKSKIALASAAANSASSKIRAGSEHRNVECEITKNFTAGLVTTRRLDTGEITDTRLMTTEERQAELPLSETETAA